MRCKVTIASPFLHKPFAISVLRAASKTTSVDSESVAFGDPSARSEINPLNIRLCLAGISSLHNTISLIENSIIHIRSFNTGRARRLNHGFYHLSIINNRLSKEIALAFRRYPKTFAIWSANIHNFPVSSPLGYGVKPLQSLIKPGTYIIENK